MMDIDGTYRSTIMPSIKKTHPAVSEIGRGMDGHMDRADSKIPLRKEMKWNN